jgi:hypothetical protein
VLGPSEEEGSAGEVCGEESHGVWVSSEVSVGGLSKRRGPHGSVLEGCG